VSESVSDAKRQMSNFSATCIS